MLVSKMAPKIIKSARDPRVTHVEGACHDDGNSVRMSSGFVTSDICAVTEWASVHPGRSQLKRLLWVALICLLRAGRDLEV